jgi:hypothetical protein
MIFHDDDLETGMHTLIPEVALRVIDTLNNSVTCGKAI